MCLLDQVFRVLMGLVLIYLGPFSDIVTSDTLSSIILSTVGIVIIISSLIGWCPFYYAAGFDTYNKNRDQD
ncbi:MAG: DUF2892 domain-containing protein [Gammaproteobacteria bacterium]